MSKRILITGASSGIGKALALELARRGHHLGLVARREEALKSIGDVIGREAPSIQIEIAGLDVTDYDAVPQVVNDLAERLGGLDTIVVNAGIGLGEKIGRGDFGKAKQTIEVNLLGAMATVDAAVALFLQKGGGHVVGISSVAAFRGMPRGSSYSASKAGFATYLEALRAEVLRKYIQVTVLYPGYIDTPLNDMLPSRPFLISVEKGAAIIATLIEKKVKRSTVPVFPWNVIGRVLKILPTGMIARM
ncbi:MAG: SDR family oxidoreductase [Desulfobacterales bacterium]|nr:SDR family oxidoreductase [Desulfobacterales bacterium]